MRRQRRRASLRVDLGRHHALGAGPEAHQHILAGPQLGHAEAAQRFHMDENVGRALAAGQEAETAEPVEPFDLGPFSPLVGVTLTWVRGGSICAGWIAVDSSIETIRNA